MAEEGSANMAGKSKQERIRDNQRRSRARRQEYLADLERRLSECHITCREASLQKETFIQLQQENHRLRELLVYAGVNSDVIENYVAQDTTSVSRDSNSSLRQIKPKISVSDRKEIPKTESSAGCGMKRCGSRNDSYHKVNPVTPASTATPAPEKPDEMIDVQDYHNFSSMAGSVDAAADTSLAFQIAPVDLPAEDLDWLFHQDSPPTITTAYTFPGSAFHCNSFNMTVSNNSHAAIQNAVPCSVAKNMIDSYSVMPREMEAIKMRLVPHCSLPAYQGAGCGVDQHILFQILSELNTKRSKKATDPTYSFDHTI